MTDISKRASKRGASDRIAFGKQSEEMAAAWLEAKGMRILKRNYRCRIGEIDIIGQMGDMLVMVEVRSRSSAQWGIPAESVNARKKQKLRQVASYYLSQSGNLDRPCRFDVLSILRHRDGQGAEASIEWFPNAF